MPRFYQTSKAQCVWPHNWCGNAPGPQLEPTSDIYKFQHMKLYTDRHFYSVFIKEEMDFTFWQSNQIKSKFKDKNLKINHEISWTF